VFKQSGRKPARRQQATFAINWHDYRDLPAMWGKPTVDPDDFRADLRQLPRRIAGARQFRSPGRAPNFRKTDSRAAASGIATASDPRRAACSTHHCAAASVSHHCRYGTALTTNSCSSTQEPAFPTVSRTACGPAIAADAPVAAACQAFGRAAHSASAASGLNRGGRSTSIITAISTGNTCANAAATAGFAGQGTVLNRLARKEKVGQRRAAKRFRDSVRQAAFKHRERAARRHANWFEFTPPRSEIFERAAREDEEN
jgi:hypothetical protein